MNPVDIWLSLLIIIDHQTKYCNHCDGKSEMSMVDKIEIRNENSKQLPMSFLI